MSSNTSPSSSPTTAFTRQSLGALKAKDLKEMGKVYAVKGYGRMRKGTLVEELLIKLAEEAAEIRGGRDGRASAVKDRDAAVSSAGKQAAGADSQSTSAPLSPAAEAPLPVRAPEAPEARRNYEQKARDARFAVTRPVEGLRDDEFLGEFPSNYDANLMTLLPINPHRAFAWWDIDYRSVGQHYQGLDDARLVIRLLQANGLSDRFEQVAQAEIDPSGHSFYFSIEPGLHYGAEIGLAGTNGYHRLMTSNIMSAPADGVSPSRSATFASLSIDEDLPPAGSATGTQRGCMDMDAEAYQRIFGGRAGGAYSARGLKG